MYVCVFAGNCTNNIPPGAMVEEVVALHCTQINFIIWIAPICFSFFLYISFVSFTLFQYLSCPFLEFPVVQCFWVASVCLVPCISLAQQHWTQLALSSAGWPTKVSLRILNEPIHNVASLTESLQTNTFWNKVCAYVILGYSRWVGFIWKVSYSFFWFVACIYVYIYKTTKPQSWIQQILNLCVLYGEFI